MNSRSPKYNEVVTRLVSFIKSYTDLNASMAERDERRALIYANTLMEAHGWNPSDI